VRKKKRKKEKDRESLTKTKKQTGSLEQLISTRGSSCQYGLMYTRRRMEQQISIWTDVCAAKDGMIVINTVLCLCGEQWDNEYNYGPMYARRMHQTISMNLIASRFLHVKAGLSRFKQRTFKIIFTWRFLDDFLLFGVEAVGILEHLPKDKFRKGSTMRLQLNILTDMDLIHALQKVS